MRVRVVLSSPGGESVVRDIDEGCWVEPAGDPDRKLGGGMWALPGLVDAHSHLAGVTMDIDPGDIEGAALRAREALAAGVGLLIDKGWRDLTVIDLIDAVDPDERPDIEAAGAIYSVEGGYWEGSARDIEPGAVAASVREASLQGRGWVKLVGDWPRKGIGPVPNFSETELETAVAVSRDLGARIAIHTMAREVPAMAVRAGVDSIEHGLFLTADDLGALGARGGIWVPTVVQVETLIMQLGPDSSGGRLLREGLENVVSLLALAVEAGVNVLTGTDLAVGSHQVALEAIKLWEMGMSPGSVIDAVSRSGLRATGRSADFEVGSPANAVFFAADPSLDPHVLLAPQLVIRRGRVVG
jgi:imidazolonepropionase-like amidohydrolase